MSVSDVEITAGLGGFLVLFGLALVVWFLGRDLTRRLRRIRHREAQLQREREGARPEQTGEPPSDEVTPPSQQ